MGFGIGLSSVLRFSPDVFLPLINGYLTQNFPGIFGYQLYFGYVAGMAALGGFAGLVLRNMLSKKGVAQSQVVSLQTHISAVPPPPAPPLHTFVVLITTASRLSALS